MQRKCESCRHYQPSRAFPGQFARGVCHTVRIRRPTISTPPEAPPVPILEARDICDREGDGHFVHFEPLIPEAGAAAAAAPQKAMAAHAF